MKQQVLQRSKLFAALAVSMTALVSAPAFSQDANQNQQQSGSNQQDVKVIETVKVTGSRIKRTEEEGPSPVTIIRAEQLEKEGFSTIGDVIETVSQNTGAAQNDFNSAGGFTPNGVAINLRGLGPGRTLLLINGRRANDYPFPYNGRSNFQNFNNIPVSATDRIEVLSGGASAIYGSDAVAGVINVILKDNYEGNMLKFKGQTSSRGGRDLYDTQWVGGVNRDSWNVVYAVEHYYVNPLFGFQREFADSAQDNPMPPGSLPGTGVGGYQPPIGTQLRRISTGGATLNYVQPAGRDCSQIAGFRPHTYRSTVSGNVFGPGCGYDASPAQQSISNGNNALSAYVYGNVDFTDNLTGWASFMAFDSKAKLSGGIEQWFGGPQPNGLFFDNSGAISTNSRVFAIRTITPDSYGGIEGTFQKFREKSQDLAFGLKGTFGERFDWEATIGGSKYHAIRDRPRLTVEGATAYFLGPQLGVTSGVAGVPNGTPIYRLNLDRFYGPIPLADYLSMSTMVHYDGKSDNASGNFVVSGTLAQLPAGDLGVAAVVEASRQSYDLESDPRIFPSVRQIYNLTGTGGGGKRSKYAAGVEFKVPVVEMLTLSAAARYDKYDDITDVDDAVTWAGGIEFRPFSNLLIRGNKSTSFKAPDMHYVFSERSGSFGTVTDYERCRANGIAPGACPGAGATYNYQAFTTSQGQPGLIEETGDSLTAGFVWDVTDNLALSLDYYKIDLNDVVTVLSGTDIINAIYGCATGSFPNGAPFPYQAGSQYCAEAATRVTRDSLGAITEIRSGPINQSFLGTKGVDGSLTYRWNTERFGNFRAQASWSHVLGQTSKLYPTDQPVNYRDQNANTDFRSRARFSLNWSKGTWDASMLATRLGSFPVWTPTQAGYLGLDSRIAPYISYNIGAGKRLSDELYLRGYVNNVFDKIAPNDPTNNAYPYFWRAYNAVGREWGVELSYKWK